MIIACPECNGKVSDTVPACPHCGFRMKPAEPQRAAAPAKPGGAPARQVACPYCAETIPWTAAECPFCRSALKRRTPIGRPPRPAVVHVTRPSVWWQAILSVVLYKVFFPVGLILNIIWYREAVAMERTTGVRPDGFGCLRVALIFGVTILCVVVAALIYASLAGL